MEPTFHIREIPIYGDLILAPMDGYSDLPFRSLCRELGSAMSYTEFVNVDELRGKKGGSRKAKNKLRYTEAERPVSYQIYGHDIDRLIETGVRLEGQGRPDIIDINMGCYVKKISERGAGAGMIRFPERIARLISTLSNDLEIPVTAKIRIGWDEDMLNYMDTVRVLEDSGASLIAVHGRTRAQGYKGLADWDAIAEIKQAVSVPVLGNGDVTTVADIERVKAHTGVDGVMIGRGAIGNPWIFSRKDREDVSFEEKVTMMRKHLALNLDFYGERGGLILFRKHVAKYIQGSKSEPSLRIPLLTAEKVEDFVRILADHEAAMGRLDRDARDAFLAEFTDREPVVA